MMWRGCSGGLVNFGEFVAEFIPLTVRVIDTMD